MKRVAVSASPLPRAMSRFLVVLGLLGVLFGGMLLPCPAAAQEPDEEEEREEVVRGDTATRAPRTPRAQRPNPPLWGGELFLTGAVDTNIERDDADELTAPGVSAGALLGVQNRARRPTLLADYRGAVHTYAGTERWDRTSHRLRVFHRLDLGGPWSVETAAVGTTGLVTVEYRLVDQVSLAPQLQFQPNRTHRLRAHAAYRGRWYRDETRSSAVSPYAGADYRYRWGSWHYADLAYRFEHNSADLAQRNHTRSSYTLAYTRPLGPRNRVRLRMLYQDVEFPNRPIVPGSGAETRQDDRWMPSVFFVHEFTDALRIDTEYRWSARRSNDERRNFDSHRLSATLRYQW
jgi:hypothetical protein